ncbi:MAG: glutamine amidotransferase [Ruminococcaceae bacterium]|nr:glutamine amidotransferase [Oscillospiraceae bacterium]
MNNKSITLCHLYGELLNLYGDSGNVSVIKMRAEKRGIEFKLKTICYDDEIDFSGVDIIMLGGGTMQALKKVSQKADTLVSALKEYVERGGVMLALCEGYHIMGSFYECGEERIDGLKILDIDVKDAGQRLIGNAAIKATLENKEVILTGFENHICSVDIKGYTPFGKVIYGKGNDGKGEYEGVIYKNLIGTHLYGQILSQNPEFADYLIKTALDRKYGGDNTLCELDDTMEKRAKEFMIEREMKK